MKKSNRIFLIGFVLSSLAMSPVAWSLDQIIRPYQSLRSAGMGGVRMTTGLYDENFFNNPARVTANPESKFTIFEITPLEFNPSTLKVLGSALGGTNTLDALSLASGSNVHYRIQLILPAYYLAPKDDRKFGLAIGLIASGQTDAIMRQSYQLSFGGVLDLMPVVTYGRKFLKNDALSVGVTSRFNYRIGASPDYSIVDYVQGNSITLANMGSDGSMINFDVGATYNITRWGQFDIAAGAAIQNILGGNYSRMLSLLRSGSPPSQPRSYGLGFSASRSEWWKFKNTIFALEFTDVLNNADGSIFKLLHIGGETRWKSLAFRLGLNQGYISAGLGFDVRFFTLNLVTYGEELGLNAGSLQDRRYGINLGFHI